MATRLKCLVVGDAGCGKTCLIKRWSGGEVITEQDAGLMPRKADNTVKNVYATDFGHTTNVSLLVQDTDGSVGMRKEEDADMVLICFDIVRPETLKKLKDTWLKEVKAQLPSAPIALIGCKCDLRSDKAKAKEEQTGFLLDGEGDGVLVTEDEAAAMAKDIEAFKYFEASSRAEAIDIKTIFHDMILNVLGPPAPPSAQSGCCSIS